MATQPHPFECGITPRSERHAEIIKQQFMESTPIFERYEHQLSPEDRAFVKSQREGLWTHTQSMYFYFVFIYMQDDTLAV